MRVLLVRLGALGDIVHAIPVAAALRRAWPDARIDWVVGARHREILELVSVLSGRVVVSERGRASGGVSLPSAMREIRNARYDIVLDLQGLMKSAVIARSSGAGRVIGFVGKYLREPLAGALYGERYDPGGEGIYAPSEVRHVVEINLGMVTVLGLRPGVPEFPLAAQDSDAADAMREATGGAYALLNPGAAWPNKRWPPERFASLASALRARQGLRSVVLWGPGERALGDAVVAQAGGAAVLSPPTRIADVVALARGAAVMVSGDTGPTHIGAAVGTPIVGLYGPTRPERNGPWLPADITVSRAATCECHHSRKCRAARWCLLDVSDEEVLAAVERRLAAGRGAHA
ncbi:MAG: glycosyltransferase family 9 protein [Vicinamibacterales bacterium]